MSYFILVLLVSLGFHGKLHRASRHYLNLKSHRLHKLEREKRLLADMKQNGIGCD